MVTTRWIDKISKSLDEALEKLLEAPQAEENAETTVYTNWEIIKHFPNNQTIRLNNKEITYNFIDYKYNEVSPGNQPIDDRSIPKDGFIIAYYNGSNVGYIINRNTDGQKILRKMLKYTGKNEVVKNGFDIITSDFFIWMISKVYTEDNVIDTQRETLGDLIIESIKGFKGDTEDLLTKISASGDTVMNIISTLSFLLESRKLNQISVSISHRNHENIDLVLSSKGIISFDKSKYIGIYEEDGDRVILAKMYLLIYVELLPLLIQTYLNDLEESKWGAENNIAFLQQVGDDISNKIARRVEALKETSI